MADRKTRISARVRAAIEAMVWSGQKRDQAADSAGLHRDSLRKALKRPDVLAYLKSQMEVLRTSASARTIAKAEQLMDSAESEHVQADMTRWLAGLEGIAPVQRTESLHLHAHVVPGLTVVRDTWRQHAALDVVIDAAPRPVPAIRRIGTPQPHPEAAARARLK